MSSSLSSLHSAEEHAMFRDTEGRTLTPKEGKKSLLVAYLTTMEPTGDERLLQQLHNSVEDGVTIQVWHPPKKALLHPIASKHHRLDSRANIYSVAVHARRAGRTGLVVIDRLTQRQLTGTTQPYEQPALSVVLVAMRPPLDKQWESHNRSDGEMVDERQTDGIRVIAQRVFMNDEKAQNLLDWLQTFEPGFWHVDDPRTRDPPDVADDLPSCGLDLHDPDAGVFVPDTIRSLAREDFDDGALAALVEDTPLPAELATEIVSQTREYNEKIPTAVPDWVDHQDLHFFLLHPTTEKEREGIASSVQEEVRKCTQRLRIQQEERKKSGADGDDDDDDNDDDDNDDDDNDDLEFRDLNVHLVLWDHDLPASRAQLMKEWKVKHKSNLCPLHFIFSPVTSREPPFDIGTLYHGPGEYGLVVRSTFDEIIKAKLRRTHSRPRGMARRIRDQVEEHGFLDATRVEVLQWSHEPFYYNPPLWKPLDGDATSIAAFFLTQKLSTEQVSEIEAAIYGPTFSDDDEDDDEWPKEVRFVPWKDWEVNAADGTADDIWETVWEMECLEEQGPYFFVDEQSAIDKTLIMAEAEICWNIQHYENKVAKELLKNVDRATIRGMRYGRIKANEAHSAFGNIELGNMGFEEFFEEREDMLIYDRPGWPGHGIINHDWEDSDLE